MKPTKKTADRGGWTNELAAEVRKSQRSGRCTDRLGQLIIEIVRSISTLFFEQGKRFACTQADGQRMEDAIGEARLRVLKAVFTVDVRRRPGQIRSYLSGAAYTTFINHRRDSVRKQKPNSLSGEAASQYADVAAVRKF